VADDGNLASALTAQASASERNVLVREPVTRLPAFRSQMN